MGVILNSTKVSSFTFSHHLCLIRLQLTRRTSTLKRLSCCIRLLLQLLLLYNAHYTSFDTGTVSFTTTQINSTNVSYGFAIVEHIFGALELRLRIVSKKSNFCQVGVVVMLCATRTTLTVVAVICVAFMHFKHIRTFEFRSKYTGLPFKSRCVFTSADS